MSTSPTPITPSPRNPPGLYTLFFTEMLERCSYYGMRGLLVLFMKATLEKGGLEFSIPIAGAIYGLYAAAGYLAALPGGWVADWLLGAQRAVLCGGTLIACGQFTLAIPRKDTFFLGLLLLVMGTGLLKPNISAIVGKLYPEGGARRDAGFTIFYMGINLGSFVGPLVCGPLGEKINWRVGPVWLLFMYLLHTLGELCVSPVGLSSITKLAPARIVGQAMGLWFLATALGNLLAGLIAGESTSPGQMSSQFWWIALSAAGIAVLLMLLAKPMRRWMAGIN